jgi:hypothetical protein
MLQIKKIKGSAGKDISEDNRIREYIFLPASAGINLDHPHAITVRIGQYPATEKDSWRLPPAYFLELEAANLGVYENIHHELPKEATHKNLSKIEYRTNGGKTAKDYESYVTEYQIKRSSLALRDLEAFTLEVMEKLSLAKIVSMDDANLLISEEKRMYPPTDHEITGRG